MMTIADVMQHHIAHWVACQVDMLPETHTISHIIVSLQDVDAALRNLPHSLRP